VIAQRAPARRHAPGRGRGQQRARQTGLLRARIPPVRP
jgi:hypothetical protein